MLTLILKATNACNLRCAYCSLGKKESFHIMSEAEMAKALEWFARYAESGGEKRVSIIFHGGEPMLVPASRYRVCIEKLKKKHPGMDYSFYMQTNGTILSKEHLELIKLFDIHMGVSLDGLREVHDAQRRTINGEGTYEKVLRNICKLKEDGIPVSALMVLTRNALRADLSYLKEFSELGLPIKINPLLSIGEAKEHDELSIDPGDYGRYLIRVFDYLIDNDIDAHISPLEYLLQGILNKRTPRGCTFTAECNDLFVCINQTGDIYPCGRFADLCTCKLGNIYKGIDDEGRKILFELGKRRSSDLPEKCKICKFLDLCHAGCSATAYEKGNGNLPCSVCEDYQLVFSYLYGDGLKKYREYLLEKRSEILQELQVWE